MMKYTSKWGYILGLPVLLGISILYSINLVSGNISITSPSTENLHKSILHSLYLGKDEGVSPHIKLNNGQFDILNGLIMGDSNTASAGAQFVTIGGGKNNSIGLVEKSGIGGGSQNSINSSLSVIGGGGGHSIDAGELNTIAGGYKNQAKMAGTVIGGEDNIVNGSGVIVGGIGNRLEGDGLVMGKISKGGNGSFSWNSSITQGFSAIIMADSGVLVGTTDPITGVNLVVDGAVKIGTAPTNGNAGEIRMQNGCFYGYDGENWHVINKNPGSNCPNITCSFGTIYLGVGDGVTGYTQPYSNNCNSVTDRIVCNPDGTLGESNHQYYPYCYNLSTDGILYDGGVCGSANGLSYTSAPSTGLCEHGTSSAVTQGNSTYTWTCTSGGAVGCSATRLYSCGGATPSGNGVVKGAVTRSYSYTPTSWTYTSYSNPGACQRTCADGYVKQNNTCVSQSPQCGTANGGSYTSLNSTSSGLCNVGQVSNFSSTNNEFYTWKCGSAGHTSVNCSATRLYSCGGATPSGSGLNTGPATRTYSSTPQSWTYKAVDSLGACEWRCTAGYVSGVNNTCVRQPAQCGTAGGGSYTGLTLTSPGLCSGASASNLVASNTGFTWECTKLTSSVQCSATRRYSCNGVMPSGDGVVKGGSTYIYGYSPTSWTYQESGTPGACKWKCSEGYETGANNTCHEKPAVCGAGNGGEYIFNEGEGSIEDVINDVACAVGQIKEEWSTITGLYWTCATSTSIVNCSATRLYSAMLDGDDGDMNEFEYGVIQIGDYYIMDRNLGAFKKWDGFTTFSDYNPDYQGYFYEWGNDYGFSQNGCENRQLAEEEMHNYCNYMGAGDVESSSCEVSQFLCPEEYPWYYNEDYPYHKYDYWGANGSDESRQGPCPEGWHVPSADDVDGIIEQWDSLYGNSYSNCRFDLTMLLPDAGIHTAYGSRSWFNSSTFNYHGYLEYFVGGMYGNTVASPLWIASEARAVLDGGSVTTNKKYVALTWELKNITSGKCNGHKLEEFNFEVITEMGLPVRCFMNH